MFCLQNYSNLVMLYLQQHVSRLNSAIGCYSATFHDGANVYTSISPVITLSHNADAEKIILLYMKEGWKVSVLALPNSIHRQ